MSPAHPLPTASRPQRANPQPLGDVVELTLPSPGDTVKAGETCGDIESVKTVNDLIEPVTGTVRARNDDLARTPELVDTDQYGQGWMFEAGIDPSMLNEQFAGQMGTIMAGFVPNWGLQVFEKPSGRRDLNRRPLDPQPCLHIPTISALSCFRGWTPCTGEQGRAVARCCEHT